ncbi:DNA polymerase IV [Janthinobacterium fluminis]|uniref:DNA polymerase IV n=1 Tax=Janthinobacterium fluminis TaxID=2987524 RepID=A0ABT5JZA8_9BURK|nr:DNA polymerase IV [Janthinobacterium fluminis]MDC8758058.1 DNA polymerase IV [Janthinobacterium fluminis]
MHAPERRIAHLDMDAFYASVELLRYPELRGLPLVIGGGAHQPVSAADGSRRFARLRDYVGRGVITTATYEARALGAGSGMGLMKAARLAPEAILLPVNFDAYRHCSRLFKAAVAGVAATIEDRGIDEIYIDLTDEPGETRALATRIKQAVKDATGLSCSIGVTPNKLLSKICSDLDKPDGLTILGMDGLAERIWPLPVRKINGIGPKATAKLAALEIHTIGELAGADPVLLQEHFGRTYALWLKDAAHGVDARAIATSSEPQSISRETTFERDLHARGDRAALSAILMELCAQLAADVRRKGYASRGIGVKLRFDDFQIVTRNLTLAEPTDDAAAILRAARECLKRVPLERRLRLLGVRASALSPRLPEAAGAPRGQGELLLWGEGA